MVRASKRLIRLVWFVLTAAIVLGAVMSVASAVRTVLAGRALPEVPALSATAPTLPTRPSREQYTGLRTSPVFGALAPSAQVEAPPPAPVVEDLPVTPLKLRLVGVVAAETANSMAVIENQKARVQNTYSVGDPIVEGAVLDAIFNQRVVLVRNGRREVLEMLPEAVAVPPTANSGTRVQAIGASQRAPAARVNTPAVGTTQGTAIRRINDNLRVINREEFEREIGADLIQTVTTIRTEPRMVGGAPSGVTMTDLGRGDTLAQLGFQEGDVVVSVNGQRVNSEQDLALLAENLRTATDVRVQVIRGNLPRTLIFKVR